MMCNDASIPKYGKTTSHTTTLGTGLAIKRVQKRVETSPVRLSVGNFATRWYSNVTPPLRQCMPLCFKSHTFLSLDHGN
eukprot:6416772-Amphidinium_carterae.3